MTERTSDREPPPQPIHVTNVETGESFQIERETVIGRQTDCDIPLDDRMASRRHARIFSSEGRYFVEDLGSRNGTLLNDEPLEKPIEIQENDEIRIGDTLLIVGAGMEAQRQAPRLTSATHAPEKALARESMRPKDHDLSLDITEFGAAKGHEDLKRRLATFAKVSNSIRRLRHTLDLEGEAVRNVRSAFPIAKRCLLILKDKDSGKLAVRAHDCDTEDPATGLRVSRTIVEEVLSSGDAIMSANPLSDDALPLSESVRRYHIHSFLCAPLRIADEDCGVLFLDAIDRESCFSREDLSLFTLLANEVSMALENASMLDRIVQERDSLEIKAARLQEDARHCDFDAIMGASRATRDVVEAARRAATVDSIVLITGPSGTGKELVARTIHDNSSRRDQPFLSLNCGAIARDLVESELFGYEKGAFTGALDQRPGLFEAAAGGSMLLDEIGEMPLDTQVKLLKVLEDKEVRRIGGRTMISVDVRVMAATNKNLEQEVREGRFRRDLFYRLNVVRIALPPLFSRGEDILPLANHFLSLFCHQMNKAIPGFAPAAIEAMKQYGWPGNVRELRNVVERIVLNMDQMGPIQETDLPHEIRQSRFVGTTSARTGSFHEQVQAFETGLILDALDKAKGNKSEAARILDLSRQGLLKKMDRYGISQ